MDYQQKLAEKLVILNERGNGVLVRMNYIKKVRESKWMSDRDKKKELDLIHHEKNQNVSLICHKMQIIWIGFRRKQESDDAEYGNAFCRQSPEDTNYQ